LEIDGEGEVVYEDAVDAVEGWPVGVAELGGDEGDEEVEEEGFNG
jgi:hypothetical protein